MTLSIAAFAFALGMVYERGILSDRQDITVIFQSCYIDRYWPDSLKADRSNLGELYDGIKSASATTRERMKTKYEERMGL